MSTEPALRPELDTLIFDMDGVLVDVSGSYRQAIIQTVDLFFVEGLGLAYGGQVSPLINNDDIDFLKQAGGFNDDWDMTTAFIIYFLEMLPPQSVITIPTKIHIPSMLAYLQTIGTNLQVTLEEMRQNKNIPRLALGVAEMGGGLAAVKKLLKRRNRHLLAAQGSLLEGNLVERIFQELYLGQDLFTDTYHTLPVVVHGPGLINNESLILKASILNRLTEQFKLGIATGRPKREAEYTLNQLNIAGHFQSLITRDDVLAADGRGKPHPWPLLEAARRIEPSPARCAYIGDTPDDIRAAKEANGSLPFLAIGTLAAAADPAALRAHFEALGADMILRHPNQLADFLM
jgi:HAD superfamily hydrolase (TIGR01548 family)